MSGAAFALVCAIEAGGGQLAVEGRSLVISPRSVGEPLVEQLRAHKQAIMTLLRKRAEGTHSSAVEAMGDWMLNRCIFRDDCWFAIGVLQVDLAEWCNRRGLVVLASRRIFTDALSREGFCIESGFVYGLGLSEIDVTW